MNGLTRCPLSCPLSLESTAMGTSTFCLFMCCQRLMKVVLQCQNQDALRSALRRPATSQNNAGSKHTNSPLFRQTTLSFRDVVTQSESCTVLVSPLEIGARTCPKKRATHASIRGKARKGKGNGEGDGTEGTQTPPPGMHELYTRTSALLCTRMNG